MKEMPNIKNEDPTANTLDMDLFPDESDMEDEICRKLREAEEDQFGEAYLARAVLAELRKEYGL